MMVHTCTHSTGNAARREPPVLDEHGMYPSRMISDSLLQYKL